MGDFKLVFTIWLISKNVSITKANGKRTPHTL